MQQTSAGTLFKSTQLLAYIAEHTFDLLLTIRYMDHHLSSLPFDFAE